MLVAGGSDWPPVELRRSRAAPPGATTLSEDAATLVLDGGLSARIDRRARTVDLIGADAFTDAMLVHPFLAGPAAAFAWWDGRESLHGGAVLGRAGAWAVLGEKGAGKSTTLATLERAGAPIVADDLIVVAAGQALAGPRCIDLAPDAAESIVGAQLEHGVRRTKVRVRIGDVPAASPLAGWIVLEWGGDAPVLERIEVADRPASLLAHRMVRLGSREPRALLDWAALPAFTLRRPRGANHLAAAAGLLADLVQA